MTRKAMQVRGKVVRAVQDVGSRGMGAGLPRQGTLLLLMARYRCRCRIGRATQQGGKRRHVKVRVRKCGDRFASATPAANTDGLLLMQVWGKLVGWGKGAGKGVSDWQTRSKG